MADDSMYPADGMSRNYKDSTRTETKPNGGENEGSADNKPRIRHIHQTVLSSPTTDFIRNTIMPTLDVPGAILSYEVTGSGRYLLLIPGGGGTGHSFRNVRTLLANHYSVITYDRRGHSKSLLTGEQDYEHRLDTDADDAALLLQHVAKGEASYVLGSSSGAIVARTLLMRHAELIEKVVLHEPPLVRALPDDERVVQETNLKNLYNTYRKKGHVSAMKVFGEIYIAPEEAELLGMAPAENPYTHGNLQYWFERELSYPVTDVGYDELCRLKDKIIMVDSAIGKDLPPAKISQAMAAKLDLQLITMPGGHVGYVTHPQEFADSLTSLLG